MVAIGQEENEMRITADGEDPINGKGPAAERVSRIDNRDLTRDAINNRGILLSLVHRYLHWQPGSRTLHIRLPGNELE
jgi:hypothetical protein